MVYGLLNQPPRQLPFSDWKAQVEHIIERHPSIVACSVPDSPDIHAYYDAGVSPSDAAPDFIDEGWN